MKEVMGDLWDWQSTHLLVIPTNLGWKKDGSNPMGAGVARQCAERYPDVPAWVGMQYKAGHHFVFQHPRHPLIFFPTKPFNNEAPYLSWKSDADIELVAASARQLSYRWPTRDIALPLVGCANGRLRPGAVIPLLREILYEDRFLLVHKNKPPSYLYRDGVEYPT